MTYSSTFGGLTGRNQVAQAVVDLLQTPPAGAFPLIVYFLAEVERQQGIVARTIPLPGSFRTGLDFERFIADELPALIVVAQPTGDAERYEEGVYGQWYEIEVGAVCEDSGGDEVLAEDLADWYGAAVMGCLAQNGGLGDPASFTVERTVLASAPKTEFLPSAQRSICQSIVTVRSFVEQVVTEQGPTSFGPDPYVTPAAWPTITTVKVQLQSETPSGGVVPQTGVAVTDSTGHVIVEE